jgi:NifU-like protein involved in Fe-S cluster formation
VADCVFRAWGCPHGLAAAAWACASLKDAAIESVAALTARELARQLDAPAEILGRLLVVEDAMHALIANARTVQSG